VIQIRDLCRKAKVPFFFKQWGGVRKSVTGRILEGSTYDEFPPRVHRSAMDRESLQVAIAGIEELRFHSIKMVNA
jgi:hypothetical protein